MLEEAIKNLEAIKAQAVTLSGEDRERTLAPLTDNPDQVFDLVKQGRALELHVVLQERPELLTRQDEYGMTPLHHASIDQSGTLAAVIIGHPSEAIWMRDQFGRIPLDAAEEMGDQATAKIIISMTYPRLFKQVELESASFGNKQADTLKEKLGDFANFSRLKDKIEEKRLSYISSVLSIPKEQLVEEGKHTER